MGVSLSKAMQVLILTVSNDSLQKIDFVLEGLLARGEYSQASLQLIGACIQRFPSLAKGRAVRILGVVVDGLEHGIGGLEVELLEVLGRLVNAGFDADCVVPQAVDVAIGALQSQQPDLMKAACKIIASIDEEVPRAGEVADLLQAAALGTCFSETSHVYPLEAFSAIAVSLGDALDGHRDFLIAVMGNLVCYLRTVRRGPQGEEEDLVCSMLHVWNVIHLVYGRTCVEFLDRTQPVLSDLLAVLNARYLSPGNARPALTLLGTVAAVVGKKRRTLLHSPAVTELVGKLRRSADPTIRKDAARLEEVINRVGC